MEYEFTHIGDVATTMHLNAYPLPDVERGDKYTVPIVGIPRGGTTMVAAVVEALGIDLGPTADLRNFHFEDQTMHSPYLDVQVKYAKKRNEEFDRWGWKDPTGIMAVRHVLFAIRNPRVIVVFRDMLATIQGEMRFDRVHNIQPPRTFRDMADRSLAWWNQNIEFIKDSSVPTLLVSYERALSNPELFIDEICSFLGISPTEERKAEALSRTNRSGGYIDFVATQAASESRDHRNGNDTMTFDTSKIEWRYINLDHREDRRTHITAELERVGIVAERFPALRFEDYAGPPEDVAGMMRTQKTIGNWLSHLALWEMVADTDRIAGVLEDDAMLCDDFVDRLKYIEDNMTLDWDILYLGATYHVNPAVWHKDDIGRDFELTGIKHIHRVYGAFSNQGYLVNGKSARKLMGLMEGVKSKSTGSDHAMILLQPQLQCYSFTPGMVFQMDGQSDIGDGFTEFSGFLTSLGPHCWAKRIEDFDYDGQDWGPGNMS